MTFLPEVPINLREKGLLIGYDNITGKPKKQDAKEDFNFEEEIDNFYNGFSEVYPDEMKNVSSPKVEINYDDLISISPHLGDFLYDYPEETIDRLSKKFGKKVLIQNHKDFLFVGQLTKDYLDKFVSVKGMCKRRAEKRVRAIDATFKCQGCGSTVTISQDTRKISPPKKCSCGRRNLEFVSANHIDYQEIWIEDLPDRGAPSQVHIYLEDSMVEKIESGKRVSISGILKQPDKFMVRDEELNTFNVYIKAHNFKLLDEEESLDISEDDLKEIEEISADDPLQKLSESFMNHINGNTEIKKAIILQAIAPSKNKYIKNKNHNIHILLVGDVGSGKTEMLYGQKDICPGARLSVGSKSSKVGLTSTVTRDESSGAWSLEAGAMPLANNSILCIDELDKMPQDTHEQILTPMSSGELNINKASFQNVTLESQTGVLASANPVAGNFDRMKPLASQVQIITPLLNRFDLIFLLLDIRNEQNDAENARAFMKRQRGEFAEPTLNKSLIKKYIHYARQIHVDEKSYKNDADIVSLYTELRKKSPASSNMPVNLRSLGAVNSLASAHAKLCLRKELRDEDYDEAIKIYMKSLELSTSSTGELDMSLTTQKMPFSKRGKMEEFLKMIYEMADGKEVTYKEIFDKAKNNGLKKWEIDLFLDNLKRETKIYEPRGGFYGIVN